MAEAKITAVHNPGGEEGGKGVWLFTCYAHDPEPLVMQTVSSPKHAVGQMHDHCDAEHQGQRMRLSRDSQYSVPYRASYTAPVKEGHG